METLYRVELAHRRIEGKRRIWCGSWSDGERWPRAFSRLQNATVAAVTLVGTLPEIDLTLSNGLHLVFHDDG